MNIKKSSLALSYRLIVIASEENILLSHMGLPNKRNKILNIGRRTILGLFTKKDMQTRAERIKLFFEK